MRMRLVVLGLTLALAASGPPAATAQAPVMAPPLASGEVLLEVNAVGLVTTRADRATMTFTITGSGETEAAARTATQQSIAEIRAMLRGHGVTDADIRVQPINTYQIESMEAAMTNAMDTMDAAAADLNTTEATNMAEAVAPVSGPSVSANAQTEIVVRNIDHVPAIQSALMERGIFSASAVNYSLNDDSGPRRQARVQAMQKARVDAESYAAALNMRVVRVVRVTERLGLELLGMAATENQLVSLMFGPNAARAYGSQVPTVAVVGVDYALAPR